jgi:hypothetical protein
MWHQVIEQADIFWACYSQGGCGSLSEPYLVSSKFFLRRRLLSPSEDLSPVLVVQVINGLLQHGFAKCIEELVL